MKLQWRYWRYFIGHARHYIGCNVLFDGFSGTSLALRRGQGLWPRQLQTTLATHSHLTLLPDLCFHTAILVLICIIFILAQLSPALDRMGCSLWEQTIIFLYSLLPEAPKRSPMILVHTFSNLVDIVFGVLLLSLRFSSAIKDVFLALCVLFERSELSQSWCRWKQWCPLILSWQFLPHSTSRRSQKISIALCHRVLIWWLISAAPDRRAASFQDRVLSWSCNGPLAGGTCLKFVSVFSPTILVCPPTDKVRACASSEHLGSTREEALA